MQEEIISFEPLERNLVRRHVVELQACRSKGRNLLLKLKYSEPVGALTSAMKGLMLIHNLNHKKNELYRYRFVEASFDLLTIAVTMPKCRRFRSAARFAAKEIFGMESRSGHFRNKPEPGKLYPPLELVQPLTELQM